MTHFVLHTQHPPSEQAMYQAGVLTQENVTDLHLTSIPPSNHFYETYRMALPAEVNVYLKRIGQPTAPCGAVMVYDDASCNKVIGYVIYLPVPTHPEACGITYMMVDTAYRKRGIAKTMMKMVIEQHPHVELTCPVSKVPFYEGLGFQVLDVHNTQVVMNTLDHSCEGLMAIEDVQWIHDSPMVRALQQRLTAKYGIKGMKDAEKKLMRHVEQLERKAKAFVAERKRQQETA